MENVRVLVVEDSLVVRTVLIKQLECMGFSPDVATDGLQAVNAVLKAPYDLILMDIMMPTMDGFEATRQIRVIEAEENMYRCPIIGITGLNSRTDCLKFGMDDYLCKPVTVEQLRGVIKVWLPGLELPTADRQLKLLSESDGGMTQSELAEQRILDLKVRLNNYVQAG
jgi:CheY-like chemotaxis protein